MKKMIYMQKSRESHVKWPVTSTVDFFRRGGNAPLQILNTPSRTAVAYELKNQSSREYGGDRRIHIS